VDDILTKLDSSVEFIDPANTQIFGNGGIRGKTSPSRALPPKVFNKDFNLQLGAGSSGSFGRDQVNQ